MPGKSKYQFVLDNFGINSAELTKEHKKRLDELAFEIKHTILFSMKEMWLLHLVGSASQTGSDAYNEDLSKRRAQSVQEYVDKLLPGVPRKFRTVALGESAPEDKKIFENPRDRAVGVIARLTGALPPPPPPPPPPIDIGELIKPRLAARKEFTLTVDTYVIQTIGIGIPETPIDLHVGRIAMNFLINDGSTETKYTFLGEGPGTGAGVFFLGGARSTASGKPQKFRAYAKLASNDFTGKGSISFKKFLFGGKRAVAGRTPRFEEYPMGTVDKFEFPPSISFPGKDTFSGEVTKGFKPRVPPYPAPLPGGIF